MLATEVFRQTGFPEYTYAERRKYDTVFQSALQEGGVHIYLHGNSKSGKSSMWRKYVNEGAYTEIKITAGMDLKTFYKVLLEQIDPFYLKNYVEGNGIKSKVAFKAGAKIKGLFNASGEAENVDSSSKDSRYERIYTPEIELTLVTQKAKEAGKIIILEDFQMASEDFISELADVLKAFADDQIKVIIVGIDNKISNIINARNDINSRIITINLDKFKKEELREIITKGEVALNIEFTEDVKNMIIDNSYERAYILQGICRYLCSNEKIAETQKCKKTISNKDTVKNACEALAQAVEGIYENSFQKILRAATKRNGNDTYRWILRVFQKNLKLGNGAIPARTIASKINDLKEGGFNTAAIYPCLKNMITKQEIHIFRYEDKFLYVDDVMFIFYLRWNDTVSEELNL